MIKYLKIELIYFYRNRIIFICWFTILEKNICCYDREQCLLNDYDPSDFCYSPHIAAVLRSESWKALESEIEPVIKQSEIYIKLFILIL